MPQLDAHWFLPQVFWLAITFIFMYVVMAKLSLPRLDSALKARKDRITTDLRKAETYKQQAEETEKQYAASIATAHAEAEKHISDAMAKASARAAKEQAELDKTLSKKLNEAEKRIADLRENAVKNILPHQVEISKMIAEKLAKIKVSDEKASNTVNAIVKGQK